VSLSGNDGHRFLPLEVNTETWVLAGITAEKLMDLQRETDTPQPETGYGIK
jgi:hypothetical protein